MCRFIEATWREMAYLEDPQEIKELYTQAKAEATEWKRDFDEYERLADNDLIENLDESLPEVNDGTLSAALFKLPKRIVNSNLTGRPKALDKDDAWVSELAKMQWENNIVKNANSQAPFHRKWKDAVRKAAIYGGIPIISLFVENGDYIGSDFIVGDAYDITLEPGKKSDYDSDIMFWDIYLTDMQLDKMIERAERETKEAKENEEDGYNKWSIKNLKDIKAEKQEEERPSDEIPNSKDDKAIKRSGHHFFVMFQRGVEAPFYMCHTRTGKQVREWSNDDPTGDVPIHYLYCYQDFINPYGIGICKLAGGTQNVLDYMRQSDVLATQLGLRPPKLIRGDISEIDWDSIVYTEDADWIVGNAIVERQELANGVYNQLPNRISMYKTSLNQLIPTGDTSISTSAGDPNYSKTPAGVKFQAANLSIDDDDFKDNLYMTYAIVAKSMINIHFANMQGVDLMKLNDEEREILQKAGLEFPEGPNGPTNELELKWDEIRATFDFEVDPEVDQEAEDKEKLDSLLRVAELRATDPTLEQALLTSNKRLDVGELFSSIIALTTDNDKIIVDIAPEEQDQGGEQNPEELQAAQANIQGVMQQYGVDEVTAAAALEAEAQGYPVEDIIKELSGAGNGQR